MFKHQHGGVVASRVFANPLTDAQMQAMNDYADGIWGRGYGSQIEVEMVDDDAVPEFETAQLAGSANHAEVPQYIISGTGHVEEAPL